MHALSRSPGLGVEQADILIELGESHGLTLADCVSGTNLEHASNSQIDIEFSAYEELKIIENLTGRIERPAGVLGFEAGLKCSLAAFGLIGQAIASAENLAEALNLSIRYLQTAFHFTNCIKLERPDSVEISYSPRIEAEPSIQQFILLRDLGSCAAVLKEVLGEKPKNISSVGLNLDDPHLISLVEKHFQCPVLMSPAVSITVRANRLQHRMPLHSHYTSKMLEAMCYEKISQTPDSSLSEKIRSLFNKDDDFIQSRDEVAAKLCMSSRTLARQLQSEGTNWRELVAQIKLERSKQLLADHNNSIIEIAESVGFSSCSAFSLAFSRAMGTSPSKYRTALQTVDRTPSTAEERPIRSF